MRQVFLKLLPFPPVSTIPAMLHAHLNFNNEFRRNESKLYKKQCFYGYQGAKDGKFLNIIFSFLAFNVGVKLVSIRNFFLPYTPCCVPHVIPKL
jgi:hypothetical protein